MHWVGRFMSRERMIMKDMDMKMGSASAMIDHGDGARAEVGVLFSLGKLHHTTWVRISSMMEKTTY